MGGEAESFLISADDADKLEAIELIVCDGVRETHIAVTDNNDTDFVSHLGRLQIFDFLFFNFLFSFVTSRCVVVFGGTGRRRGGW